MKTPAAPKRLKASAKTPELRELVAKQEQRPMMAELYRRAEIQLRKTKKQSPATADAPRPETDPHRLLQELQIHQIELEMQNAELRQTRDKLELVLENYTDLYDFAPVGYFTLAGNGSIQLANLTGAHLAGMECSRLVGVYFGTLVCPEHRVRLAAFLKEVFASENRQSVDVELLSHGGPARTVNIKAQRLLTEPGCRAVVMDISDRKRVEAATAQLAAMVNSSSDAIIGQDLNSVITSWNTGAQKIFGYTAKEIVGQPITRLIAANRHAEEEYIVRQLRQGKSVEQFETVRLTKAGQSLDVAVTVSPFWNASGKIVGASKVMRDITAHKRAEDIVRVSEVRYRRLFEAAHDGVLLLDPATRQITDANPFMTKLLGYRHDELVGKELFEIGLLKDEAASQEMFRKLKRSHEVRYEDLPLESRAGRHQEVEVVANLYQENGHPVIQCNIRDITERKAAVDVLRRSEALFSALVEQAPVGVYVVDAGFHLQQANPTALPVFRQVQPLLGRDFSEIMRIVWPKRVADEVVKRFRHTLKTGEPYQSPEFGERRQDTGELEFYEWQIQRVTLPAGEHGVVCFFNNITARKSAEATQRRLAVLAASNKKLENEIVRRRVIEATLKQSEQKQGDLLAESRTMQEQLRELSREILRAQEEERKRISRELHDVIAQTLTGINVRLATLKKEAGRSGDSFERNIARTQEIVGKSVAIVHQFARELRPAVLDDLGLIPALHSYLKDFSARTGLQVKLAAFAAVEEMDIAKRTVLFRVAQEALTNVMRHAQARRVDINLTKLAAGVSMHVKDDGKSFQVERVLRGTGSKRLGLLGMRERVEMVGGTFCVESTPGKGTIIQVEVPLANVRAATLKKSSKTTSLECP